MGRIHHSGAWQCCSGLSRHVSLPGLPMSLLLSPGCHPSGAALGHQVLWGSQGAAVGSGCWAPAVPWHSCQRGPAPRQGTPEVFWPACWAPRPCGSCCQLRFGPSQRIWLPGGLSLPPDIWINPRLLRAGRLWVVEGGGMPGRGGKGWVGALLAITSTPSYRRGNLMIKNNPRLERKHV